MCEFARVHYCQRAGIAGEMHAVAAHSFRGRRCERVRVLRRVAERGLNAAFKIESRSFRRRPRGPSGKRMRSLTFSCPRIRVEIDREIVLHDAGAALALNANASSSGRTMLFETGKEVAIIGWDAL